jgi:tetratricopeptide (TPR) repeat protein
VSEPVQPPAARVRADDRAALVERARAALVAKRPLEALSLLRALEPAGSVGSDSAQRAGEPVGGFPRAELAKALLAQARKLPKRPGRSVPHEALALLRGAVEADSSSVAAHLMLAEALRRGGQRDEALTMYRRVLVLTEAHRGAHRPERRTAERVLRRLAEARPQRRPG